MLTCLSLAIWAAIPRMEASPATPHRHLLREWGTQDSEDSPSPEKKTLQRRICPSTFTGPASFTVHLDPIQRGRRSCKKSCRRCVTTAAKSSPSVCGVARVWKKNSIVTELPTPALQGSPSQSPSTSSSVSCLDCPTHPCPRPGRHPTRLHRRCRPSKVPLFPSFLHYALPRLRALTSQMESGCRREEYVSQRREASVHRNLCRQPR